MRSVKLIFAGICLVGLATVLVLILPGGLATVAQSGQVEAGDSCCDRTFAVASHPSIVTAGSGFPISQSGGQAAATSIWVDTDGRRALVTVECTAGDLRVAWDQAPTSGDLNPSPARLVPGQAITIFAKNVWVYNATGGGTASGFYYVAVDVSAVSYTHLTLPTN